MKKKLICSILALSLALIPMGYLAPAQTVQAEGVYGGYHVVDYTGQYNHPILEDTLLFEDITKPESYTLLPKGSVVKALGTLHYEVTDVGFVYVDFNGVKGYVDKSFIDFSTTIKPKMSTEILRVYNEEEGVELILTPSWKGEGWYDDQFGWFRNAQGQKLDAFTGEVYVEPDYQAYALGYGITKLIFKDGTELILTPYDHLFEKGVNLSIYTDQNGVFRNHEGKKVDPNTREILE